MTNLVTVHRDGIYAESTVVAKKIALKHKEFMRRVRIVIDRLEALPPGGEKPDYRLVDAIYRGQEYTKCLMSREFFSLVMMRFETPTAFEWQVNFNKAFYEMEARLLKSRINQADEEWQATRLVGKTARLEETNVIKDFVEYATDQGSKNARYYYKHITNATYKGLGLMAKQNPKIRDEMDVMDLPKLMLCEKLVAVKLREYMEKKRHYKDIYESVRDDLREYAAVLNLEAPPRLTK